MSLKQNLMKIRCSFTPVILAGQCDRKTALTQCLKNAQKKHTRQHGTTPLGRLVHKGYSSRYLRAHNCTTGGFHAAFKFRELLGCITYCPRSCIFYRLRQYSHIQCIHCLLYHIHTAVILAVLCVQVCTSEPSGLSDLWTPHSRPEPQFVHS
jgi:hypothetical protein